MATNSHRIVREWLDAERAGQTDAADVLFRSAAGALPPLSPPAGFADAVIARLSAAWPQPDIWTLWWVRGAVAVCVLLVGVAGGALPPHVWLGGALAAIRGVAVGLAQVSAALHAWVSGALALWAGLGDAAIVVGRQVAGPASLVLLGLNFAIAAAALFALRRLMPLQEN